MSDAILTREEASQIALAAAKEAVREHLTEQYAMLGYNIANFEDMKRLRADLEFASRLRNNQDLVDDLDFLHHLRVNAGKIGGWFLMGIITIVAGAVAIAMWEGIKASLRVH